MRARFRVQAFIGETEAVDWLSVDDVGFDNFVDIGLSDVSVPDCFRIDDQIRAVLALIEASGLVGADASLETAGGEFLLKQFLQARFCFRIAASARMARRALVAANEYVVLELGHQATVTSAG